MKTLIYKGRRESFYCEVDDNNYITAKTYNGNISPNTGSIIGSYGGIEQFINKCELTELSFEEWSEVETCNVQARKQYATEQAKIRAIKEAEQAKAAAERAKAEYEHLTSQYAVIPTTRENLSIVGKYLATVNWGVWNLPKMSISYVATQYDCDGKTAVAFTLANPVDGSIRYEFGAPRGHLNKYTKLR